MLYAKLLGVLRSSAVARQQPDDRSNSPSPPGVPCRPDGCQQVTPGRRHTIYITDSSARMQVLGALTTAMVACSGCSAAAWAYSPAFSRA